MKKLLLFFALGFPAFATITTAANCTQTTVQAAITAASSGDTILVPGPCSPTWSGLTIPNTKGITLSGGGNVTIADNAAISGTAPTSSAQESRVTGFIFTNVGNVNTGDVSFDSTPTSGYWRIDHCTFNTSGMAATYVAIGGNGPGVFDHNTLTADAASEMIHNFGLGAGNAGGWTNDVTPGSSQMVFVENNTFTYPGAGTNPDYFFGTSAVQSYYGGRTVVRYNTMNMVQVDQHGTMGNIGARWWEVYNNVFNTTIPNANQSDYIVLRAGSGVVWGNTQNGANLGGGNITLYEEDTGYPALYQIGRGYNQALSPAYVWGNGVTMTVGSGSANVQLNRDFFVSGSQPSPMTRCELAADGGASGGSTCPTTYNYVPYTYPNPAATQIFTVCKSGSGCDFTTINAAIQSAAVSCGDTIQVKAGLGDGTGANGAPSGWYRGGDGLATNNPIVHTKACAGNNLIMTSDQTSKLPDPTTRITPAYADGATPVVPTVYNPANGMILYAQPGGGGVPASGLTVIGMQFCCSNDPGGGFFSDWFDLGSRGQGTNDGSINVTSDIPNSFVIDRVLMRADPTQNIRKCITFDAPNTTILNVWIDCGFDSATSDSQAINGGMGTGSILNSYVSGTTETISVGGALPPVFLPINEKGDANGETTLTSVQTPNITLSWNEVSKPKWIYTRNWTATTAVAKGQVFRNAMGTACSTLCVQAQNTGTTGGTEPTWPSLGGTVVDGGVTWKRTNTEIGAKNGFECKTSDSVTISNNFLHFTWPQGQQGYLFTFTSSPSFSTQAHCNSISISNNYARDIGTILNDSGMDLANDLNAMASVVTGIGPWTITAATNDTLDMTVNGTHIPVTLTAGVGRTATQVAANINSAFTTAGWMGNAPACATTIGEVIIRAKVATDLSSGCTSLSGPANTGHTDLTPPITTLVVNSITHNAATTLGLNTIQGITQYGCFNPRTHVWYGCGLVNGLSITNNIFSNVNTGDYYGGIAYLYALFQHMENITIGHNTSLTTRVNPNNNITTGINPLTQAYPPFNVVANNNIFGWISGEFAGMSNYWNNGTTTDFTAVNYYSCQASFVDGPTATPGDPVCAANKFAGNVLPNSTLAAGTTITTTITNNGGAGFNRYVSNDFNNTTASLMLDPSTFALGITLHGTDGLQTGADTTAIPRILSASISTLSTKATLTYTTTAPVAGSGYGCQIYVTTKDSYFYNSQKTYDSTNYAPVVADMDPSLYTNPGWDNNNAGTSHSITIGNNSPLTPSTTYYLRLMCPGASWPEDGTSAAFSTTSGATAKSVRSGKTATAGKVVVN